MKRIIIIVLCVVIIMGILYVFYKDQYKQKNENKTILWKKNTDENNFSAEMNKNNFFKLIMDVPDWKAKNDEDILKPLINYLSNRPDEEIYAFHDIMNELLYNLAQVRKLCLIKMGILLQMIGIKVHIIMEPTTNQFKNLN